MAKLWIDHSGTPKDLHYTAAARHELKGVPYDFDAAIRGVPKDGAQALLLLSSGVFFAQ